MLEKFQMSDLERLQLRALVSERKVRRELDELARKRPLTLTDLERAAFIISEIIENSHDTSLITFVSYKYFFELILRRGLEKMLQALETDEELESDSGQSESSFNLDD